MAHPSTPQKPVSSSYSSHSTPYTASSASGHGEGTAQTQEDVKKIMGQELQGATCTGPISDVLEKHCPVNEDVFNAVVKRVHRDPSIKGQLETWPSGASESQYYDHFIGLVNAIIVKCLKHVVSSVYSKLQFYKYDRNMAEGQGKDSPLKPDILGLTRRMENDERVSWRDVDFPVEVKSSWSNLILQAATYARCIRAFQRNRRIITMIYFNHVTRQVKVGIHTVSWLCVTKESIDIRELETMVRLFLGICSWSDRFEAGFDVTCNDEEVFIPAHGIYKRVQSLCSRPSARGRQTRVDLMTKVKGPFSQKPGSKSTGELNIRMEFL